MAATLTMPRLGAAIDKESYHWLTSNCPELVEAIEAEVAAGKTPEQIKRFVVLQTARLEIALRCEQCARYVLAQGAR